MTGVITHIKSSMILNVRPENYFVDTLVGAVRQLIMWNQPMLAVFDGRQLAVRVLRDIARPLRSKGLT